MSERFEVTTDAGAMPVHLWLPPAGHGPGVLLLQEIFGISDYVERRAAELAQAGYVVAAPEVFWRLGQTRVEIGPDMLEQGVGLVQQLDWPAAVQDCVAALAALRARDEVDGPVGIVGFCFGGGLGFNVAAASDPDCLVSYYGSALPDLLDLAPQVTCPQLHHFGTADAFIDGEKVDRIEQVVAGPTTEFHRYEGADHAFDNADWPGHHPRASAEAWPRTLAFLERHLQS